MKKFIITLFLIFNFDSLFSTDVSQDPLSPVISSQKIEQSQQVQDLFDQNKDFINKLPTSLQKLFLDLIHQIIIKDDLEKLNLLIRDAVSDKRALPITQIKVSDKLNKQYKIIDNKFKKLMDRIRKFIARKEVKLKSKSLKLRGPLETLNKLFDQLIIIGLPRNITQGLYELFFNNLNGSKIENLLSPSDLSRPFYEKIEAPEFVVDVTYVHEAVEDFFNDNIQPFITFAIDKKINLEDLQNILRFFLFEIKNRDEKLTDRKLQFKNQSFELRKKLMEKLNSKQYYEMLKNEKINEKLEKLFISRNYPKPVLVGLYRDLYNAIKKINPKLTEGFEPPFTLLTIDVNC